MDDPGVILEKLSAFSRMLRLEGLIVSPQETADAGVLLTQIGFADRQKVKTALRTVFAKSREDQLAFDRVFDGFFISEEAMRAQAQQQLEREQELEQRRREAEEELLFNGQPMDLTDEQKEAYTHLPDKTRKKLKDLSEKYKDNVERNPELYANFIHSVFAKTILEQQLLEEDAGIDVKALDPDIGLMYRDISQFKDTEIPKAISIIQTVSRQIAGELTARKRRGGHSAVLDFRRTIRKGLETGGSLYRLKYKKRRSRKKQLVMLCDVSGSMVQFSEFALRFIQSLGQVSDSSRTFLFSEDVYEADAFSLRNMDLFRSYVRSSGVYGRGTDLGSALETLCDHAPPILGPATTLLILSDTKTIDQPRAVQALLKAKTMAGRVLWLNPIPESKWPYIGSVRTMSSLCQMVSCNTLSALAAACRKLTRD